VAEDFAGSHVAPIKSTTAEGFDTRDLRNALGTFGTGVTIITARSREGKLVGMTANSFTSVSLEPPLVLWSQSLYAQSLPAFQEAAHFVVNVLAADQVAERLPFGQRRNGQAVRARRQGRPGQFRLAADEGQPAGEELMLEPKPPAEDQVGAEQRPGLGEPGRRGARVTGFQAVLGQVLARGDGDVGGPLAPARLQRLLVVVHCLRIGAQVA